MRKAFWIICLLTISSISMGPPASSSAQEVLSENDTTSGNKQPTEKGLLVHPPSKPAGSSKWFIIVEGGGGHRSSRGRPTFMSNEYFVIAELGLMKKTAERSAWGLSGFWMSDHDACKVGLKGRYRCWFDKHPRAYLDFGPGIVLTGGGYGSDELEFPGFIGHVELGFNKWLACIVQVEKIRFRRSTFSDVDFYLEDTGVRSSRLIDQEGSEVNWYLGGKLVGYPGIAAGLLAFVTLGMVSFATGW